MAEERKTIVHRTPADPGIPVLQPENRTDVEVIDAKLWPTGSEQPVPADIAPSNIEVSLLARTRRLVRDFPVEGLERPYLDYLERRILRFPRDLETHVRRILMFRSLRDANGVAGALADLFLVLGTHGRRLRSRLLAMADPLLTPEQLRFFVLRLDRGLNPTEPMPNLERSRLSRQVSGTTKIVICAEGGDDPVTLAKEAMANSQYGVAQELLEGALHADPGDRDASALLLDLYERTQQSHGFFKTYTALLGRRLAHRDRWAELAAAFRASKAADREDAR